MAGNSEDGEPSWRQTWGRSRPSCAQEEAWALEIIAEALEPSVQRTLHGRETRLLSITLTKKMKGRAVIFFLRILGNSE